jgi:hypothetical protein
VTRAERRRFRYVGRGELQLGRWFFDGVGGLSTRLPLVTGLLDRCSCCSKSVLAHGDTWLTVAVAEDQLDFVAVCEACDPYEHRDLYLRTFGAPTLAQAERDAPLTFLEFWAELRAAAHVLSNTFPTRRRFERPR